MNAHAADVARLQPAHLELQGAASPAPDRNPHPGRREEAEVVRVVALVDRQGAERGREDVHSHPGGNVRRDARGGRRASPLIAQVRRIGGHYYPVLTAFRSEPSSRIDWNVVRDFMRDAQSRYSGIHVYGGW